VTRGGRHLALVSALAIAASGCGVPVQFTRIDNPETTPVKGVRFVLRRPGTYAASLIFDLAASQEKKRCFFMPVIEQRLDGPPITYEATSKSNPFTETNVAFTIDEKDGALTALTAGATDQLGPLLENLADVAAKAATLGARAKEMPPGGKEPTKANQPQFDPKSCGYREPDLEKYVEDHIELARALQHVHSQIAGDYLKFATSTKPTLLVREVAALEKAEASLKEKFAAHRFPLNDDHFQLFIGETLIAGGKEPKNLWLTIVLRERKP
jgi:hypothetical protein